MNAKRSSAPRKGRARAARAARNDAPRSTVDRILDSARLVLVKHGYAQFTTRRVAQAAGMAPGNLSYHFPSKRELVRALIERLLAELSNQYQAFFSDPNVRPGEEITALVRWGFMETVAQEPMQIYRELWTMSLRDAEIRRAVDDLYDGLIAALVQLMRRLRPQCDVQQIREYVLVLWLLSEGSNVLYGTRRSRAVPYERIIDIAIELQRVLAPKLLTDQR